MKVVDIVAHVLSSPLEEPFAFSQGWVEGRNAMVVELLTDEGVTGWGESLCHGLQPPEIAASFLEHCFNPMLIGRDPFDVEVLWEEMYNRTRPFGGGAAINAISGVDVALWDAIGRYLGQPVHKLLGGAFRSELTPYATGFYRRRGEEYLRAGVEEARRHLSEGFSGWVRSLRSSFLRIFEMWFFTVPSVSIRASTRATSGLVWGMRRSASTPSAASPTTSMPSSTSNSFLKPRRMRT